MNSITSYSICAPIGAFGNHIRWIVLLGNKFKQFRIVKDWDKENYDKMKGISWPADFTDFHKLSDTIQDEIVNFHNVSPIDENFGNNIDDKLKFIVENVYFNKRSWHNWLHTEWKYREAFNKIILFKHKSNQECTLHITIDPELSYNSYIKFNTSINNKSKKYFINVIKKFNAQAAEHANVTIDGNLLFNEVLDKNIYNILCDTFDIENNYQYAQIVHSRWYHCHKRSEKNINAFFSSLYT